jgi:hypothetical protein
MPHRRKDLRRTDAEPADKGARAKLILDESWALTAELNAAGYRSLPARGIGGDTTWPPEQSPFVMAIAKREARRIGEKFFTPYLLVAVPPAGTLMAPAW